MRILPYETPLAVFSPELLGEVRIEPGERRKLIIDGYVEADVGGHPGVVVKTAAGEHWYCNGMHDGTSVLFVLDDAALLNKASNEMIVAAHSPIGPVMIPIWVIVLLGVGAPITLFALWRTYNELGVTR